MFFVKARPESDWHGTRSVSEVTVRPEIFFEADRDFQEIERELNSPTPMTSKRRLNIFTRRRKTPQECEPEPGLKCTSEPDAGWKTRKKSKAKKKFSFMANKTKSNAADIIQVVQPPPETQERVDYPQEFKYSDISTFVKVGDCNLQNNRFLKSDFVALMNILTRRRKTPQECEPDAGLKCTGEPNAGWKTNKKNTAKKKFSFITSKTKSNLADVSQVVRCPPEAEEQIDYPQEFKYSDISTFVKVGDCDIQDNWFLETNFIAMMRVAKTCPGDSPSHSSQSANLEGTSISESFLWKANIWNDLPCEPTQPPSLASCSDDHSESQASSTLEKRHKAFFPFRIAESKRINKQAPNRKSKKKGIDHETTKQLNQMISLVASEELNDPWEESWNRWQCSETFTVDSMPQNERTTPASGWADFSIFDKPPQLTSTAANIRKNLSKRLMNTPKDFPESRSSQDSMPPFYEGYSPWSQSAPNMNSRCQRCQRTRGWFRPTLKHNNVFQEAQLLLDILHETFPDQELD